RATESERPRAGRPVPTFSFCRLVGPRGKAPGSRPLRRGQRHEASPPSAAVDVGVDVGGTFTDFVGFRGREVVSLKLPSTRDPSAAVLEGMHALVAAGMAHGTTVATNAILLLFSFIDPAHERRLAKALRGMSVSTSHEVLAEFREFERSSTTALDAYVKPLVVRYLRGLERAVHGDFYVMKSSGGVVPHKAVLHRPVDMVLSGPAGGIAAAVAIARATGHGNLLTFDMGGTSADFSTIVRGAASWTTEAMIDAFPLALPVVDIESVGAGGGSIAWIDAGRSLRVGPGSAGADPGPIAYGKGGESVTVTDADLSAGVLGPTLLGGRLPLHADLAAKGIARLADSVHLSSEETVLGVQRVVRATMAKAMRIILARRGLDPRDFALLAFGGAGPMHAWSLARELR